MATQLRTHGAHHAAEGVDLHDIAPVTKPSEIWSVDYSDTQKVDSGWLDL